jgi:hypothetical protein
VHCLFMMLQVDANRKSYRFASAAKVRTRVEQEVGRAPYYSTGGRRSVVLDPAGTGPFLAVNVTSAVCCCKGVHRG